MTLIFDHRTNLAGQPGLHVFIAGVSAYGNLPKQNEPTTEASYGLRQLSSAALTAYKIYHWLLDHQQNFPVPLATCRLLLSPSTEEISAEPNLKDLAEPCTLKNFLVTARDWQNDAGLHAENMTIFYFAGHGAQRTGDDAILLLEDFGDGMGGILKNAVSVNNIFTGMAPSNIYPKMAQTQLYFIDACHDFFPVLKNFAPEDPSAVFRLSLSGEDRRHAPIFYAAAPGTTAVGIRGKQTLFSEALLDCFNGDAGDLEPVDGEERWHVSIHSLSDALKVKIDDLNTTYRAKQEFTCGGWSNDQPIYLLDHPPTVEVVLEVVPADALACTKIEALPLGDLNGTLSGLPVPLKPHPYHTKWQAGYYIISAKIDPPDPRFVNCPAGPCRIVPPRVFKKVKVIR